MPAPGGYWLPRPDSTASAATRAISGGPSVSGKPWPRLTEPVSTASADISAKIVVPIPASALLSSPRLMDGDDTGSLRSGTGRWHASGHAKGRPRLTGAVLSVGANWIPVRPDETGIG